MQLAPIPVDEAKRLEDLHRLNILDTAPEERFDRIARIIKKVFQVEMVFITFIDEERVWMKARAGSDIGEEPRDVSICGHTICNLVTDDPESRIMELHNIFEDKRFADNPFLLQAPELVYYVGFNLQSTNHHNVGTLCFVDTKSRQLTTEQKQLFAEFGFMVEAEMLRNTDSMCNEEVSADFLLFAKDSIDDRLRNFSITLKRNGISVNEWRVLHEIVARRVCFPNRIADDLRLARSSITRLMDLLESKGLIERKYGEALDRRQVSVVCTETGNTSWKQGFEHANKLGSNICDELRSFDWGIGSAIENH